MSDINNIEKELANINLSLKFLDITLQHLVYSIRYPTETHGAGTTYSAKVNKKRDFFNSNNNMMKG